MLYQRLFPQLKHAKWDFINLDDEAEKAFGDQPQNPLLDPNFCNEWVKSLHLARGVEYSYGGWMENRANLWRGHYHKPGHTIHLGIDYNVPDWTEVFLPRSGVLVMSENDPDQDGGWGGRAIYKIENYYVIFAHLMAIEGKVGRICKAGTSVGLVGNHAVNGNWFPHLHVQCMKSYNVSADGYGDITSLTNYPDPELYMGAPNHANSIRL